MPETEEVEGPIEAPVDDYPPRPYEEAAQAPEDEVHHYVKYEDGEHHVTGNMTVLEIDGKPVGELPPGAVTAHESFTIQDSTEEVDEEG